MSMQETIGLVGGASGQTLCEALHEQNKRVALVGGKVGETGMDMADETLVCDLQDTRQIIDWFKSKSVQHILLGTGHIFAIRLMEACEQEGLLTSIHIPASLLAKDKIKFKQALQQADIVTPKFAFLQRPTESSTLQRFALPVVVKSPLDIILPQKASSAQELESAIEEVLALDDRALIEEFVDGTDITIPLLANFEQARALFVSYYSKANRVRLKGFEPFKQAELSFEQEQCAMVIAQKAVAVTGVIGLCRVDMIVAPNDGMYILECNSVTVTGEYSPQQEFSEFFVRAENEKHNIRMGKLMVQNALIIFEQKEVRR